MQMNDINNALKKELEEMQKELDKQTPELKKILDEETKNLNRKSHKNPINPLQLLACIHFIPLSGKSEKHTLGDARKIRNSGSIQNKAFKSIITNVKPYRHTKVSKQAIHAL